MLGPGGKGQAGAGTEEERWLPPPARSEAVPEAGTTHCSAVSSSLPAACPAPAHGRSLCPGPPERHRHPHVTAQDTKTHRVRGVCPRPRGSVEAGSSQTPADGPPKRASFPIVPWCLLSGHEVRANPGTLGTEFRVTPTVDTAQGEAGLVVAVGSRCIGPLRP